MLDATDTEHAPWHIVNADDQRRARLNLIRHFLHSIPFESSQRAPVALPERDMSDAYDDRATMASRRWVENKY